MLRYIIDHWLYVISLDKRTLLKGNIAKPRTVKDGGEIVVVVPKTLCYMKTHSSPLFFRLFYMPDKQQLINSRPPHVNNIEISCILLASQEK